MQFADADAEHHAAFFLAVAMQRDGIVTVRRHRRDGVGALLRLDDIEAEHLASRPRPTPRGARLRPSSRWRRKTFSRPSA